MERAEVVVRQSNRGNEPARVGAVLSRKGANYLVRWEDDGEEENVRLGGPNRLARRDSLRHQFFVDPTSLRGRFAEDPVGMVLRVLREQGSKMTAVRIKQELEHLGLDADSIRVVWSAAQRAFGKIDQVDVAGKGSGRTYLWRNSSESPAGSSAAQMAAPAPVTDSGPARPDEAAVPDVAPIPGADVEDGGGTGAEEPNVPAEANRNEESPAHARHSQPPAEPHGGTPPQTSHSELAHPVQKPKSLLDRLAEVAGDERPGTLQHYLSRPLWVGSSLDRLDNQSIDDLLATSNEQDRKVAETLLLALPRQLPATDGAKRRKPLEGATVALVLAAAAEEVRSHPEPDPAVVAAGSWLLRRACTVGDLPTSAVTPMVELIGRVGKARQDRDVPVIEASAALLSRLLPGMSRDERVSLDLDQLAPVVAHLPLKPDGGRAALLAAVGKVRTKCLLASEWWDGVTLDDLAECAIGVLGGVTSRPEVAELYVHPLVARELSQVTSRVRLSFLLGLPGEFVGQVPGEAVAAAFRRVAAEDQVVAGWTGALAQDRRVEALRRDVDRAQAEVAHAEHRAELAEQRASALADRCERLEETLRAEHSQSSSLRSAQDRQIQIDVIRSLADLAAEVEELAVEQTASEILVERVRALVSAQTLEPIGQAGQKLTFDPTVHEPIVGGPTGGTAVTVIRPGYRWRPSGEDILVEKALVTTT